MNTGTAAAARNVVLGRDMVAVRSTARLAAFVAECVDTGVVRRLLLVRLSRLPRALARPHHMRLVRDALEPLASANRAQLFHLPRGDIAIAWRGMEDAALARSREAIDRRFEGGAVASPLILTVLRLPDDAAALLADLDVTDGAPALTPAGEWPLDPHGLARLEQALAQADIAPLARRERIYALDGPGFRLAWERRFLSVEDMVAALMPGVEPRADPWLFARLTRTFDRRMLSLLSAPGELRHAGPFSLDLNVASLLSPEFMRFDAGLPHHLRGHVVLDLVAPDILADLAAFGFARDFARQRGYRLGLRGVGAELAPALPAGGLGFDLAYADWAETPPDPAAMAPAILVLTADTHEALAWGRSSGVTLFRGAMAAEADHAGPSAGVRRGR